MSNENPTPAEVERRLYLDGIELFNGHAFFEAHEKWEDAWHTAWGVKHSYYQGLIQCAVALEHYQRGNPRGVIALSKSYPPKFNDVPGVFMGLDVARFLAGMAAALRPVTEASVAPEKGTIALDLVRVPRIDLAYDPFETGEAQRYAGPE
jgi:hypothetical protein